MPRFRVLAAAFAVGGRCSTAARAAAQDGGIPVESELVRTKCGSCHTVDKEMRMTRISYRRATPENWERTIKRMVTLNKVELEPADARAILKYLADHNGLAPEEAKMGVNEAERRLVDFAYPADKDTADLCGSCHAVSRVVNERRTKDEWDLLIAMHRGYYPLVDNQPMNGGQGFRRTRTAAPEPAADGRPPDTRHPMDRAIAHLAKTFPLQTPEWAAWSAGMQSPKLAGRWAISGYQPGKGPIYGAMTVTADPEAAGHLRHRDALHDRADRRDGAPHRARARLHRLPVAGPRRVAAGGRGRHPVARGDDDRSGVEADVRPLVHRRLRRDRRRRAAGAARQGPDGAGQQCRAAEGRRHQPAGEDLRRQPAGRGEGRGGGVRRRDPRHQGRRRHA